MNVYYKGYPIFGPRGPAGPDGSPIGTIISFMGLSAPKDYLVCDGAEYPIPAYPALADFFAEQFGSANHFGGDGETTFAVPDMRNLFLRGYHGEAEEQLSGEIGERQEGTEHLNAYVADFNKALYAVSKSESGGAKAYRNADSIKEYGDLVAASTTSAFPLKSPINQYYISRPVNMAVLYCIKAVESKTSGVSSGDTYSLEETRIGTWIDGKPLYRRVISTTTPSETYSQVVASLQESIKLVDMYGSFVLPNGDQVPIPYRSEANYFVAAWISSGTDIKMTCGNTYYCSAPATIIVEYTKTTDKKE